MAQQQSTKLRVESKKKETERGRDAGEERGEKGVNSQGEKNFQRTAEKVIDGA